VRFATEDRINRLRQGRPEDLESIIRQALDILMPLTKHRLFQISVPFHGRTPFGLKSFTQRTNVTRADSVRQRPLQPARRISNGFVELFATGGEKNEFGPAIRGIRPHFDEPLLTQVTENLMNRLPRNACSAGYFRRSDTTGEQMGKYERV
jgi:hypothetical protein